MKSGNGWGRVGEIPFLTQKPIQSLKNDTQDEKTYNQHRINKISIISLISHILTKALYY